MAMSRRKLGGASKAKEKAAAVARPEKPIPREVEDFDSEGDSESQDSDDEQGLPDGKTGTLSDDLSMEGGFAAIVDKSFVLDPEEEFAEIKEFLAFSQKASRVDYGTLVDYLEQAQAIALKALILFANARVSLKNFEADADVINKSIRLDAVKLAEEEFSSGKRSKKPTLDDIDMIMKTSYHDEYRALQERTEKARAMVGIVEGLVTVTRERARDLRQMVASSRH